jgi:hypothetical protein
MAPTRWPTPTVALQALGAVDVPLKLVGTATPTLITVRSRPEGSRRGRTVLCGGEADYGLPGCAKPVSRLGDTRRLVFAGDLASVAMRFAGDTAVLASRTPSVTARRCADGPVEGAGALRWANPE